MNFLAHLYLSDSEEELVGNFIADHVKGKEMLGFPAGVQRGIRLHRAIDYFTDRHPLVRQGRKRLFPTFSHYAAVLIDLYYDHFLATHFKSLTGEDLHPFTKNAYTILHQNWDVLPAQTRYMLPYMERDNWLYAYRTLEGIGQACSGLARRARFNSKMELGEAALLADYAAFEHEFQRFFPDLINFVESWEEI